MSKSYDIPTTSQGLTLEEADAEIERLRAALEPFAALADRYDPVEDDDEHTIWRQTALPTLGQLRRARAALEEGRT